MIRSEVKILFVKENEFLAFVSQSYNYLIALNMSAVICMLRLSDSHQHKVGYIYDSIDRSHSAVGDKSLHPGRRFLDIDVIDYCSSESLASVRLLYLNRILRQSFRKLCWIILERNLIDCSKFSCNSKMSPQVRSVTE